MNPTRQQSKPDSPVKADGRSRTQRAGRPAIGCTPWMRTAWWSKTILTFTPPSNPSGEKREDSKCEAGRPDRYFRPAGVFARERAPAMTRHAEWPIVFEPCLIDWCGRPGSNRRGNWSEQQSVDRRAGHCIWVHDCYRQSLQAPLATPNLDSQTFSRSARRCRSSSPSDVPGRRAASAS
jgi:hypothetical protein